MAEVGWGLIGCGDIAGRRVAAALRSAPGSRLVAVSRRRAELLEEAARLFEARRAHASWTELLRDPEVDAVYLATPVHLHAEMAIAAAEAGKHVLSEKPMALDVRECDRMIAAAERSRVKLGVAYYRRFYPILLRVKALLAAGALGEVVAARADVFEPFDPEADHPRRWLLEKAKAGGGPMFDFGCHRLEVLLHLFGPVAEARGVLANTALRREVEDTAVGVMRFVSGPVATVTVSHAAGEARDTFEVIGRRGCIRIPRLNGPELRLVSGGVETVEQHPPAENLHLPLVEQFVRAVLRDEPPAVDGQAGREVNRLLATIA